MKSSAAAVVAGAPRGDAPARAFRHLRLRLVRNQLADLLGGSRLRVATIAFCCVCFWVGLFILFLDAFRFVDQYFRVYNEIVEYLFSTFFLSLMVMLVFSTGIILYAGLFQSREAAFLLTTPASADRVFAFKFAEAMAYSSGGFLLLGSPLMLAYGLTARAPWTFYALCVGYLPTFVMIPGALGAVAALLLANFLPRQRKSILVVTLGLTLAVGATLAYRIVRVPVDSLARDGLNILLGQLAFTRNPFLPSRWMARGLLDAARGDRVGGVFYFLVLLANAGFAYLVAAVLARDLYRQGYSRVQGGRAARRRVGWYGPDALFHRVFGFLPRTVRLLILKDLRTFRRDPTQWSQFLIFFGLLAFYFVNIRRLGYNVESPYFRNLLSFLNLAVTALILSTFTSRFIFPLLSLEGRNFWVLGLLPLRRDAILWGKFAFAAGIALVATEFLVILSDLMLKVAPLMLALHAGMVAVLCLGLSGISVGLGARLPDLKEDDPSKIAVGFGGTLNLLVSLVFVFLVVFSLAVPCHLYFASIDVAADGGPSINLFQFKSWMSLAIVGCLILGVAATLIPLKIGMSAFRRMEF